ncbi:MAG: sialidase family protein [Acidimicrobiia bacterium]
MSTTRIAVGTHKGGYVVEGSGRQWSIKEPLFPGWKVTAFGRAPNGTNLAAVGSNWFGVGIHTSSNLQNWEQTDSPPAWPEGGGRKMEQVWAIHNDGARLWAGVSEAGLFSSDDEGRTWAPIAGLNEHETRPEWKPGFGGLCAHRILTAGSQIWVGISAVGVFRSDDGAHTWHPKNDGVPPAGLAGGAPRPDVGYCVHGLAQDPNNPNRIWRQDHAGMFRTNDGGDTWELIENGLPSGFGFVIWRDDSSGRLFTIPLTSDENRVPVGGELRVYASDDDGENWQVAGSGWSEAPQYTGVLRGAFDGDNQGQFCFGTTGGKLWLTDDNGNGWQELAPSFPRIDSIRLLS